ncbi:ribosomal protein S18-alanine N-acetyltransferase [Alteromonas pelagimontana]|uniref:[Ribosomal protein bS18]-alanine N-acetyltransferase n=1 Tax=Alteromonas pelagimontana TaxID=1858656 RepID=A0A6M4M9V5_9ALTE|nr:ribosomal protein S18-alanine N-acetyltransferase [Alteromonas pelagimontana]QJR79934.1 ribosomal protein S18-alanine N-acetyltransferase [Alteromonas pelagimontana]
MTAVNVSLMMPEQLHAAYAIHKAAVYRHWSFNTFEDCSHAPYCAYVATLEGSVIGYALLLLVADEATLMDIAIDKDHQRRGVGTALLKQVVTHSKEHNMASIWLEVRSGNKAALSLYSDFGFVTQEIRKGYYPTADGTEDAIIMRALLNP